MYILPGSNLGTASSRYNTKFHELEKNLSIKVSEFVRLDHFDPYGFRKGSATHASTSTTSSPPTPSIMLRGEWSLGEVLDVYWKYAEAGDQYLGRVLAGFQPNHSTFDTLPPHFTIGFENQTIKSAMCICFPIILQKIDGNSTQQSCHIRGLLQRLLASFVYHSDFLKNSPFRSTISLIMNSYLDH